jgi:hypothetical protein
MEKTKDRRKLEQSEPQQLPQHVKSPSNAAYIATSCQNFATDFISSQIWVEANAIHPSYTEFQ